MALHPSSIAWTRVHPLQRLHIGMQAQLQKAKQIEIGARKAVRAMLSSLDSAVSDLQELRGLLGRLQRRLQARTSSSGELQ